MTASNVLDLIGNTPLLRLNEASKLTGCEILGKAEFLNPGQSVKDRAALSIIRAAEADDSLKPGGIVVEGTAGNTCLLYTSPSPRDQRGSRMPSSA